MIRKLLIVWLFTTFISSASHAASAALVQIVSMTDTEPNLTVNYGVIYAGNDVPGHYMTAGLSTTVAKASLGALLTAIAADIRAFATNHGFTVAANQCFLPAFMAN